MKTTEAKKELGKCASCKTWFSRIKELTLWVDYDEIKVEVCPNCAKDYYPEAVLFDNLPTYRIGMIQNEK